MIGEGFDGCMGFWWTGDAEQYSPQIARDNGDKVGTVRHRPGGVQ